MTCLVRGTDERASAIAVALYRAGCFVALHDVPTPAHPRRGRSYVDAFFEGDVDLEGTRAYYADDDAQLESLCLASGLVTVTALPIEVCLETVDADVLVDARACECALHEPPRDLEIFTLGAGDGYAVGAAVDLAVPEPRANLHPSLEMPVLAADPGIVVSHVRIGQRVERGEVLGRVGLEAFVAPRDGIVAGITRSGVPVRRGTTIAQIDPRPRAPQPFGLDARGRRLAAAVCRALKLPRFEGERPAFDVPGPLDA